MKTSAIIITTTTLAVLLLTVVQSNVAAPAQDETDLDINSAQVRSFERPRIEFIRTVDFYLRDGQFVTGKVVEEDKSKITVEQRDGSTIKLLTYTKKEVDSRTVRISNVPEHRFYDQIGDYFAGRTWDFRDDPDDFIGAVRAYQMAKAAATKSERRQEEIDQIQAKIDKLEADRQTWVEQVRDRAKLKEFEFQATFDERMKDLESRFDQTTQLLDQALERFDVFAKQTGKNFDGLKKNLSDLNGDITGRLQVLEERIEKNRQLIDDVGRFRYYRRYY